MKVIHLFRTGPESYGLLRNLLCTLPGLVRHGIDTIAIPAAELRSGPTPDSYMKQLEATGARIIPLQYKGRLPFAVARQLSAIAHRERPDIIHTHGYKTDVTSFLANPAGALRVTTIHGWLSRTRKERFFEWLNLQSCKKMDAVIVFCEDYRTRLTRRGLPDRLIHNVPVGLDLDIVPSSGINFRRQWNIPDNVPVVAQIGRLSQEKRPDLFLKIAAQLSPKFPDARFILIGRGIIENQIRAQAAALNNPNILLPGYITAISDALDSIDIAVNSSTTEAMPRTLIEAALKNIPAVATAVGGVPDMIQHDTTGILCPLDNPDAIRDGIERLLADPALRAQMGAAARQRALTAFNTDIWTQKLIDVYQQLLARRQNPAAPTCTCSHCK